MSDTSLPAEVTYGYVLDQILRAVGDSGDADALPDRVPAEGRVTFQPSSALWKVSAPNPARVIQDRIVCTLDGEGFLADPQGQRGVWLVAGAYRVTYELSGSQRPPEHEIVVGPEHTRESPLWLTNAMPPGGPIIAPSQYAELSARLDALGGGTGGTSGPVSWADVLNKPSAFTPEAHRHLADQIDGLPKPYDDTAIRIEIETAVQASANGDALLRTDLGDEIQARAAGDDGLRTDLTALDGRVDALEAGGGSSGGGGPLTGRGFPAASLGTVGDTYVDLDATVGALVWRKWPDGWRVQEGDAGWRNISGLLVNGYQAGSYGAPSLRRINGVIYLAGSVNSTAATADLFVRAPAGFELAAFTLLPVFQTGPNTFKNMNLNPNAGAGWDVAKNTGQNIFGNVWSTAAAWPTGTLPGTAA